MIEKSKLYADIMKMRPDDLKKEVDFMTEEERERGYLAHDKLVEFLDWAKIPICPSTLRKVMMDDFGFTAKEVSVGLSLGHERGSIALVAALKYQSGKHAGKDAIVGFYD